MKKKTKRLRLIILMLIAFASWTRLDSKIFYFPDHQDYATPAEDGYNYEEVSFLSKDSTKLSGWFIPAQGKALGIFFDPSSLKRRRVARRITRLTE